MADNPLIDLSSSSDSNLIIVNDTPTTDSGPQGASDITLDPINPSVPQDNHCAPPSVLYKHNDLLDIQGGNNDERYHVSQQEWLALNRAHNPSTDNPYMTLSDMQGVVDGKQDQLTFDSVPTHGSLNPVTSDGINAAITVVANAVNDPVTGLPSKQSTSEKDQANGYAGLDSTGKIPSALLPDISSVVDVATFTSLPNPGIVGKLYVTIDTGYQYQWDGSSYKLTSTDNIPEGASNKYYTDDRVKTYGDAHYQPVGNYAPSGNYDVKVAQTISSADIGVGGINQGDSVTLGPDLASVVAVLSKMLTKVYYPTLNNPTFSLSENAGYLIEVASNINVGLTLNYNQGSIYQSWNNTTQAVRSGSATTYNFYQADGTTLYISQPGNFYQVNGYAVAMGYNYFKGTITYNTGPQPLDSKGNPYSTPYPAGTSTMQQTLLEGVYPLYATTSSISTPTKQNLVSQITGQNLQYTLAAETGGYKQQIQIAQAWWNARPITGIYYYNTVAGQFDSTNRISDFAQGSTTQTIQGVSVTYKTLTNTTADRGSLLVKITF